MSTDPIYSDHIDDPDMMEIVEMFVMEIPRRIQALEDALAADNQAALNQLAHQMKGAAGGYGFHAVTDAARIAENAAHQHYTGDALREPFQDLINLMQRLTASTP